MRPPLPAAEFDVANAVGVSSTASGYRSRPRLKGRVDASPLSLDMTQAPATRCALIRTVSITFPPT